MKIMVEIRAAEGGDHSKKLVERQASIYLALAVRSGL